MGEAGIFAPDALVELLNGLIVDEMPIGPLRAATGCRIIDRLRKRNEDRWLFSARSPVRLNRWSEVRPDLMLLRPRVDYYQKAHPAPADVFLRVELADSDLRLSEGGKTASLRANRHHGVLAGEPRRTSDRSLPRAFGGGKLQPDATGAAGRGNCSGGVSRDRAHRFGIAGLRRLRVRGRRRRRWAARRASGRRNRRNRPAARRRSELRRGWGGLR